MSKLSSQVCPAVLAPQRGASWRPPAVARTLRLLLVGALAVAVVGWRNGAAQGFAASGGDSGAAGRGGASSASLESLRFPAGSRRGLLAERIWLYGVPAQVLVFDTPLSPPELIRTLSGQQPGLTDLNVLSGQAILSGQVGRQRWVVQMEGLGARRTAGSISAVSLQDEPGKSLPDWLPPGARIRLDVVMQEDGVRVSERIWQYALPPAQVAPMLEARLLQHGWRRLPASGDSAPWWSRQGKRMRLSLVPLDGGSGLLVSGRTP